MMAPVTAPGVNLAGYFDATLGLGEAVRQVAGALEAGGALVAPLGLTQWLAASPTPKETPIECTKEPVAPPQAFLGRVALVMGDLAPAKIGELAPPPPPATLPATTQPVTTQPTER